MRAESVWKSITFAMEGVRYFLRTQRNAKIHAVFTIIVIIIGYGSHLHKTDWAILVLTIGFVWVAEMLNTTFESLVDLVHPGEHPLAKVVKDVAAGAVLFSAIIAAIIGLLILGPPLWQAFNQIFFLS
ncbi:MAG: hypothetical protein B6242_12900 [Anaerolineaceae bacterium 4572_78]|nr:MAG: hypothetical protein B6242_12900 [Anaerolineaceae bacterium 4572_78]